MAANEEVNAKNIMAIKGHSEYTRTMVRALQTEVEALKHLTATQVNVIKVLQQQVSALQVKVYTGGQTSNGNNTTTS